MTEFVTVVKSTIDKAGVDIAQVFGQGVKFVDLDDMVNTQAMLASDDSAIVWQLLTLDEDPVDPLWMIRFGIGAKTTTDPGNYGLAELLDAVHTRIKKHGKLDLFDFSPGGDGVTKEGDMYFVDVSVDPQLYDKQSGIRLISVTARAVRGV